MFPPDNHFASFVPNNHFETIYVVKEAIVSFPDVFTPGKRWVEILTCFKTFL